MADIWTQKFRQRNDWAQHAYDRFVAEVDPELVGDFTRSEHITVVVYGTTQVGKTTLILDLLGIRKDALPTVSEVLRGGQRLGKSSTAAPIRYGRSPDDLWYLEEDPTHTALSRQWELLQQLPKRAPGITVSELLARLTDAGYSISRRSIERDLRDLSLVFPLQCNDGGTPFGWYWKPGVSVELQGITLTEAVSLALVEDAVRPLLPGSMLSVLEPRFEHARQKLKGLEDGNPAARWPDKVASVRPDFNLRAPEIRAEVLEALQHALISEQQVHCQYYSAHTDKLSELTLNPLAIVQRGLIT